MTNEEEKMVVKSIMHLHCEINKVTSKYYKKNNARFEGTSVIFIICNALAHDLGIFIPIAYKNKQDCDELKKNMMEIIEDNIDKYFDTFKKITKVKT